jgi:drug/metabolite transporter (DMT)-like permease
MSYTVGDGAVVLALAAGVVGYVYVKHESRRKRLEIIHQERLVAMEKGIPLPEFPLEPARNPDVSDPTNVIPILGTVLLSLSLGTMIVLYFTLQERGLWISPLPFAFLGVGLLVFHFLKRDASR